MDDAVEFVLGQFGLLHAGGFAEDLLGVFAGRSLLLRVELARSRRRGLLVGGFGRPKAKGDEGRSTASARGPRAGGAFGWLPGHRVLAVAMAGSGPIMSNGWGGVAAGGASFQGAAPGFQRAGGLRGRFLGAGGCRGGALSVVAAPVFSSVALAARRSSIAVAEVCMFARP
jgi:hypothetical protein